MNYTIVHSDERGSINILTDGLLTVPEVTILETKKGFARGGCIHPESDEYFTVISGRVLLVFPPLEDGTEINLILMKGMQGVIKKKDPHYFIALEDSVVMEWGPGLNEKNIKYPQMRQIVDNINRGIQ